MEALKYLTATEESAKSFYPTPVSLALELVFGFGTVITKQQEENFMKHVINLGFSALYIEVDEQGTRPEVYIGLEGNGAQQGICMVSQAVDPKTQEEIPNAVRCLVWGDPGDEDYTNAFQIDAYDDVVLTENIAWTSQLYRKMFAEQETYLKTLSALPVKDVLESHALEYSLREDILYFLEEHDLEDAQAITLLNLPNPLTAVFCRLQEIDADLMANNWCDNVEEAIETTFEGLTGGDRDGTR